MVDAPLVCPATGRVVPDEGADCARCAAVLGGKDIPPALYWCAATRPGRTHSTPAGGPGPAHPADAETRDPAATPREVPVERSSRRSAQTRFPGYAVERVLGQGGGGVVYRVHSRALDRSVALKILRAGHLASDDQLTRFLREIEILRAIDDPGVVRVLDSGVTSDGTPWYAMDLIEGLSLAQILAGPLPPPLGEVVRVVEDVARTLARLHARGIFHRDVKPGNVLISGQGRALLSDFGVALEADRERLSRSAQVVGTPRYMAPEQVACTVLDWARVDVFALGVLLGDCILAAGRGAIAERTPRALAWIAARATALEPDERQASAAVLARDLAAWRRSLRSPWRATALLWRTARPLRNPAVRLAAGLVAAGLAAGWPALTMWRSAERAEAVRSAWAHTLNLTTEWTAAGRTAEAATLLERFAARPEIRGTGAEVESLLVLSALNEGRGHIDAALTAAQRALAAAREPAARVRPLAAAVALASRDQRADLLARLIGVADRPDFVPPGAVPPAARAEAALADRRLDDPDVPEADRRLLQSLARGRAWEGVGTPVADLRGDEGVTRPVVVGAGPDGPHLAASGWRVPSSWLVFTPGGGDLRALAQSPDGELRALGRDRATLIARGLDRRLVDVLAVGDRLFLAFEGLSHGPVELRQGLPVPLDAETEAQDFHVLGMAAGDLDGDGRPELIASLGPPHGMMVRIWKLTPSGVSHVADRRLGYVRLAGVIPPIDGVPARLIVTREDRHPSWPMFGREAPDGGPCGVISLALRGETLEVLQDLPFRETSPRCPRARGAVSDLDADGRPELLLTFSDDAWPELAHTWIYRQTDDGALAPPLRLNGLRLLALEGRGGRPRALVSVGPDPQTSRIYQTGDEFAALPSRDARRSDASDATCGWLPRTLGDPASAAVACEAEAEFRGVEGAAALVEAASSWLAAGDPGRAHAALRRINGPGDAPAVATLRTEILSALAITAPEHARSLPEPEQAPMGEAMRAWLRDYTGSTAVLDLSHTLPPAWDAMIPQATRHDPLSERLSVRLPAGAGGVLRLPLRATGGPVRLVVAGSWTRGEWASHARILLRPQGAEALAWDLTTKGGSDTYTRRVEGSCGLVGQRSGVGEEIAFVFDGGSGPDRRTSTGEFAGPPHLNCRTRLGDAEFRYAAGHLPWPAVGEAWELVFEGAEPLMGALGQMTTLTIARLELSGLEVAAPEPRPRAAWTRWALGGEAPARGPLAETDLDQLAILERLDGSVVHRLRPLVGDPDAGRVFARAYVNNAGNHLTDPEVQGTLRSPPPLTALSADDRSALTLGQAAALTAAGERAAAREAVSRAIDLARAAGPAGWRQAQQALAMRAEWALAEDDHEAARLAAREAVAAAPDPDLGRRLLRNRPRFEPLLGRPGWEMLGEPTPAE